MDPTDAASGSDEPESCVEVEIDLFMREVIVDNLLPIYRHALSSGSNDDGLKCHIILTTLRDGSARQRSPKETLEYFRRLPDSLEYSAVMLRDIHKSLNSLASFARRKATPDELAAITARCHQRNPALCTPRPLPAAADGDAEKSASAGSMDEAEGDKKIRALEERVAKLEAELEAVRRERDMLTPSVMSDVV
jgi:hypothetical protein